VTLVRFTTLRHLSRAKLRTALTVFGLALGVALYVAIRLCNESVDAAFRDSITGVSGAATLEVLGGEAGFDEITLETVAATPGVDFGANATGRCVRFAYTSSMAELEEAARRIGRFVCGP